MPDVGAAMGPREVWGYYRARSGLDYELEHITQPIPVPTGVAAVDRMLGGGVPVGTFTVVGGEGGTGKSALACLVAYNAARAGRMPVFFSMEMPAHMVVSRMLSVHSTARVASGEWPRERLVWWSSTGMEVTRNMGGIGPRAEMLRLDGEHRYRAAQRYLREHGEEDVVLACWRDFRDTVWPQMAVMDDVRDVAEACEVVGAMCDAGVRPFPIIDYLQLGASGDGSEYENVTAASHLLQRTCKERNVPMLVLSSLRNVSAKEREDAPQLGWFRGSGHVGYDAGTAVVLMRDGERDARGQRVRAHVIKNRVGRVGDPVTLTFNGARNLFGSEGQ